MLAWFGWLPSDVQFEAKVMISRQQDQIRVLLENRDGDGFLYDAPSEHEFTARVGQKEFMLQKSPYEFGTYYADFPYTDDVSVQVSWQPLKASDVSARLAGLPKPFQITRIGTVENTFVVEWSPNEGRDGLTQQEVYIYEDCYLDREPDIFQSRIVHEEIIDDPDTNILTVLDQEFDVSLRKYGCAYFAHVNQIYDDAAYTPPENPPRFGKFTVAAQRYEYAGPVRF